MRATKLFSLLSLGIAAATLSACDYSNTFQGEFNGQPATLSAYSQNIDSDCVALTLNTSSGTLDNFISAQQTFDPNKSARTNELQHHGHPVQCKPGSILGGFTLGTSSLYSNWFRASAGWREFMP